VPPPGDGGVLRRAAAAREASTLLALVVLCALVSVASPYFFTLRNVFNVLQGMSTIGVMAVGMTMVLVAGGLDLSVGSILAVGAVLTARLMTYHGVHPWLAVACGLAAGLAFGAVNGLLVTRLRIVPFIATLGTLSVGRGLAYLLAAGGEGSVASNVPMRDPGVAMLGAGYVGPVPVPVLLMLALVALAGCSCRTRCSGGRSTRWGATRARRAPLGRQRRAGAARHLRGDRRAVRLAGVMSAGLLSTASTTLGQGVELDVIAAAVIGGTSLQGGEGSVWGALLGAAIMAVVRNAFVLLGLPLHFQTMIIGAVILLAVGLDRRRRAA
jgi:ribose transport system permease protein